MATFPKLKTNAIAQYPVSRREQFQNQTVRFVDGSEQRYRDSAGARMQWEIQLSDLDEGELSAVEEFFLRSEEHTSELQSLRHLHFCSTRRSSDLSEQRYRDSAGARMQWEIQLSDLDEGELSAVEEFFLASQGAFGSFSFTDPWDGHVYDNCSVAADELALVTAGEMRGSTKLTLVRNI